MSDCGVVSCRYNNYGCCMSEEDRKVCIRVANAVLYPTKCEFDERTEELTE